MSNKPITYAHVENGEVTEQRVFNPLDQWVIDLIHYEGVETWLPIIVETPDYNRVTHHEVRRENRIEKDRVVRVRIIEPIEVTPEMIKAECQRRIIELTGGGDLMGSLVKQANNTGKYKDGIDRLRAKSNAIEAMSSLPIEFRDNRYW